MTWDEAFTFSSRGIIDDGVPLAVSGDYIIQTDNDMFGVQIGADLMFRRCKYAYGVQVKAAPMINFSEHASTITTNAAGIDPFAAPTDLNVSRFAEKNDLACIIELNFIGTHRIHHNTTLHATYNLIWMSGMALAGEQFDFQANAASRVNDNGHLFNHGITAGLECIW